MKSFVILFPRAPVSGYRVLTALFAVIVVSSFVLCFAACASTEARVGNAEPGLQVRPAMILVTPDQALKHGMSLQSSEAAGAVVPPKPLPDGSAVLTPGAVKVYSIGRYADPADPDLLHEAHLVYRRETAPRWNLQPGPAGQVLIGTRIAPADPKSAPLQSQELQGLLERLQREQAENRAALEKLRKFLEQLSPPAATPAAK